MDISIGFVHDSGFFLRPEGENMNRIGKTEEMRNENEIIHKKGLLIII